MMKRFITAIKMIRIVVSYSIILCSFNKGYAQTDFNSVCWPTTNPSTSGGASMTKSTPNGGTAFTPKGNIRILFVPITSTNAKTNTNIITKNWHNNGSNASLIPDIVSPTDGAIPELFYKDFTDFNTANNTNNNIINLSKFYYEASQGQLKIIGECLTDPRTGLPMSIEVDPASFAGSYDFFDFENKALQNFNAQFPNFDWSRFDLRTNNDGSYNIDNSVSPPDNIIDFIVFMPSYSSSYKGTQVQDNVTSQLIGYNSAYYGSLYSGETGGAMAAIGSTTIGASTGTYSAGNGFSIFYGEAAFGRDLINTFLHEIAHNLYGCPHYMSANQISSHYYNALSSGWGMMKMYGINGCANAWERYILGWSDIQTGPTNIAADIQTSSYLVNGGIYLLRDNPKYGDNIRIKIPHTSDNYLWIENHQGLSVFDNAIIGTGWHALNNVNLIIKPDGVTPLGEMDKGVYMFLESTGCDRNNPPYLSNPKAANGLYPLIASGRFDYQRGALVPNITFVNSDFELNTINENIFAGVTCKTAIKDDINSSGNILMNYYELDSYGHKKLPNEENFKVNRENINGIFNNTFRAFGGQNINSLGYIHGDAYLYNSSDAEGVGLNGSCAAVNRPMWDYNAEKYDPLLLNGLSVKIIGKNILADSSDEYIIQIDFNDNTVTKNRRWCGNIEIPNGQIINIGANHIVTVDKSGTPDRRTGGIDNDFINRTYFKVDNGGTFNLQNNSHLIITGNSTVEFEPGSNISIDNNASIIIEPGSKLILGDGQVYLNGTNASIYIKGTLEIPSGVDLTINGTGYYKFASTHQLILGNGSKVNMHGNSPTHTFLVLDPGTTLHVNNHTVNLKHGQIQYNPGSRIYLTNNTFDIDQIKSINNSGLRGFSAIEAVDIMTGKISNSSFDNFTSAIYLHDNILNCAFQPTVEIKSTIFDKNIDDIIVSDMSNCKVTIENSTCGNSTNISNRGMVFTNCNWIVLNNVTVFNKLTNGIE